MKQSKQPFGSEFEETTFCYMEQLFRFAYSRVGNVHDAEDLLQETYLKAFRAFGGLRRRDSIKSWLTHILVNTINDHRRKGLRVVATVDISDLEEDSACQPNQLGPEEVLCNEEIDPSLSRALSSIPEMFLTPLLLREIQDATYEEIAQTLAVPVGTVMSRLFRARALLRDAILLEPGFERSTVPPMKKKEKRKRGASE